MLFKFDSIGVGFHSCFDFVQHHERYERLLRRAKTEDLSEVSGIGCLYQSGIDKFGRPVIVFIGKWFNFTEINLDKVFDTKKSSHDNKIDSPGSQTEPLPAVKGGGPRNNLRLSDAAPLNDAIPQGDGLDDITIDVIKIKT